MRFALLVITLVTLAVGFLPAYALSRDVPVAVTLAGGVALALGGIGGIVCTVLGSALLVGVVPVTLIANGAALWWLRRDRRTPSGPEARVDRTLTVSLEALFVLGALFVPALVLLAYRAAPPHGWDPRSIFWFHASWFEYGGSAVKSAFGNPYVQFSHVDYPPGPSGLIASFWKFTGGEDLALARDITAVQTAMALAGLAWLLMGRRRTAAATVLAVMFLAATPALAGTVASEGYVDMVCAAFLVGAFVAFRDPLLPAAPFVGSTLLMAASLTKGEGLFFGVFIAVVAVIVVRSQRWVVGVASVAAFVPVLAWLVVVRLVEPRSGEIPPGGFIKLTFLRSRELTRFRAALPDVVAEVLPYLVLSVLLIVALVIAQALDGHRPLVTTPVLMVAVGALLLPLLGAVYAAGPFDLDWWVRSSVSRVTTASKLLLLGAVVMVLHSAAERERWPVNHQP